MERMIHTQLSLPPPSNCKEAKINSGDPSSPEISLYQDPQSMYGSNGASLTISKVDKGLLSVLLCPCGCICLGCCYLQIQRKEASDPSEPDELVNHGIHECKVDGSYWQNYGYNNYSSIYNYKKELDPSSFSANQLLHLDAERGKEPKRLLVKR